MRLNAVKSLVSRHKRLALLGTALLILGAGLGVVLGTGLVMAGEDALSLYAATLESQGVPVVASSLTESASGARLEVTLLSASTQGAVLPEDKANQHRALRDAALFKERGLQVDEVAVVFVDAAGCVILSMERPLDEGIAVDESPADAASTAEVVEMARDAVAHDYDLAGISVCNVTMGTLEDGAEALTLSMVAGDPAAAAESLRAFLGSFRWDMPALWAARSVRGPAVIQINVDDRSGAPLVRYTADLQLQHDSGWFAPGMPTPGPGPYVPPASSDAEVGAGEGS